MARLIPFQHLQTYGLHELDLGTLGELRRMGLQLRYDLSVRAEAAKATDDKPWQQEVARETRENEEALAQLTTRLGPEPADFQPYVEPGLREQPVYRRRL